MDFCVYISLFSVVDNTITLFNCFFRDFRGFCDFRDFRGFDLAISVIIFTIKEQISRNSIK